MQRNLVPLLYSSICVLEATVKKAFSGWMIRKLVTSIQMSAHQLFWFKIQGRDHRTSPTDHQSEGGIPDWENPFYKTELKDYTFVQWATDYNNMLESEKKWTSNIKTNEVPLKYFPKSFEPKRPGIYSEPLKGWDPFLYESYIWWQLWLFSLESRPSVEPWKGCNVTIPVFFKTAHENFEVRQILRKYFLKEKYQNETLGQYFVVGISKDLNSEKFQKIKDEAVKYDDIIIGKHFYIERFFGKSWKQNPMIG